MNKGEFVEALADHLDVSRAQADRALSAVLDIIAEQIRALGHPAPGTFKEFVKLASIKEVEGAPKSDEMIRHLVAAQEATARTARKLFPVVEAAGDQPTADLLTQRLEIHEKTAWMLRSLLEE